MQSRTLVLPSRLAELASQQAYSSSPSSPMSIVKDTPPSSSPNMSFGSTPPFSLRESLESSVSLSPRASRMQKQEDQDSSSMSSRSLSPISSRPLSPRSSMSPRRSSMVREQKPCDFLLQLYDASDYDSKCKIVQGFFERGFGIQGNIVDKAVGASELKSLVKAVTDTGLANALSSDTFTVFAPTDKAFQAIGKVASTLSKEQLAEVLKGHVVKLAFDSRFLLKANGLTVFTLAGTPLTFEIEGGSLYVISPKGIRAKVIKPNVYASNGVVHVIDQVLL